ncbi:MAG: leucine-rich repeat protein, partial [Pseudobdellovibrionaceae bacterium]
LTNCHEVSSEDLAQITGSQGASFFYIREFHQSPRPGDFDGLSNVNSIRFDFAPAAGFEPGAFRGLTSLETLWLGGGGAQKMAALNPGAFEGLSQLKSLSITASEVTQIPAGAFDGLTYLTSFGLDLPNLQEIEPGAFANLRYAGIHIPCQKLEKIIVGIFKDYAGPRITFCDNQKAPMPANIFMGTKKVQTLKLDLNGSTIDPEIFNGLSKVESLDLFLANAQSLDPRIFSKMPMLKSLSLKSVHPLGLTSETFKYNSLLERVSLSGSYQSFETELFASNPKMNLFDYSGVKIRSNPFNELCNRYKFRIVYGYEVWGAAGHVRFLSCH